MKGDVETCRNLKYSNQFIIGPYIEFLSSKINTILVVIIEGRFKVNEKV